MKRRFLPWQNWSYSKLELLLFTCPRAFQFRYVDSVEVSQWIRRIFGSAIHRMARQFFALKNGFKSEKSFLGAWKYYWWQEVLEKKYPSGKIRFESSEDPQKFFATGISILKRFYQQNLPYRLGEFPLPEVEKRFSFWFKGHRLIGVVDRIQPVEGGGKEIWDYKTGLREQMEKELRRDVQFTFYQLDHLKRTGFNPERMLVDHLSTGKKFPVPLRKEEDFLQLGLWLDEATVYVKNILQPIPTNWKDFTFRWLNPEDIERRYFSPRPGRHCNFCDYEEICLGQKIRDKVRERWISRELAVIPGPTGEIQLEFSLAQEAKRKRRKKDE